MDAKKIIGIILGLFVLFSIAFLAIGEFQKQNAVNVASPTSTPVATPKSDQAQPLAKGKNAATDLVKPNKIAMTKGSYPDHNAKVSTPKKIVNGLYFHGTHRCYTCNMMEGYIREVLKESFSEEVKKGLLTFESINVERPESRHYIQTYQLQSISFFLSLKEDDKEISNQNLDRIWRLAGNEEMFKKYIKIEIKKFLEMQN